MKDFLFDLNDIIPVERNKIPGYIGKKRLPNPIMENFSRKEVILGFGLLKFFNESFKYLEEDDWKLIIHEGVNLSYMFDYYESDIARFLKKLYDIEKICKSPVPKNLLSIPNGLNELFEFAEFNQGTKTINGKTLNQFSDEINLDSEILSMENEEALAYKLTGFLLHFDENIREIFNKIDFMGLIFKYYKKDKLSYILSRLNRIHLSEKYFASFDILLNSIIEFIDKLCDYEFHRNIEIPFNEKKQLYRGQSVLRDKYLVEFLFNNTNLDKYDKINIYDPCCDNINLIFNSIDFIKSKNNKCEVNFYGKLNFKNSIFDTTKVIINSYLDDNNIFLSSSNKPGFPFEDISVEKMDFIISDYRMNDLYEDNHFLLHLQYKFYFSSKLVAIFNKKDFYNPFMYYAILNDNLESIITFHDSFVLILNSNKLDEKKNKFLLVDYPLLDKEFINKIKYYQNLNSTDIEIIPVNSEYMNQILKSYVNFTDTSFSKVILNKNVVKDYFHSPNETRWGYNCPGGPFVLFRYGNEIDEEMGEYPKLGQVMNRLLKEFNFNNLLYDLKIKPYSLVKQKNIRNTVEFFLENFKFVPLHSLITFDINKLNVKNPDEYKIEKYGYSFYVNSDKIKRDFLLYYLDSERGKKEYNYFKNGFGSENEYRLIIGFPKACSFIYIRIPLVDIALQEYILACENKISNNKNISLSSDDIFTLATLLQESNKEFFNDLSKKMDDDKVQIMEHADKNTEKIIDEIDKLGEQLKEFNISLDNRRKNIQKELENAKDNDIKLEKIYNKFNHDSAEEIKNSVENCIDGEEYNKEEKNLIKTLGESAWNKLSDQSKRFLISSKITFNTLYKLGDIIDYSGVCLLVTKALEVELTKRFYVGFYEYLEDNGMPFREYHTSLVVNDEYGELKKLPENRWTLGGIPYILCYKKHPNPEMHEKNVSILIEYSKEKLFRDLSDEEIRETLRKYGKEIKNLTFRYRNPAAHTNELQCSQAKKCLDFVIYVEHFLKTMLDSFDKE